jgi:ABC-type phosphate transport system substrate-binding protein
MNTRRTLLAALFLSGTLGVWVHSSEAGEEPLVVVVIVNKANPAAALAANELRPIFQTTKTGWSSGGDATPFNLPDDNRLRQTFDQAVLGLDPDRIARYWKDRKIRGGARAPRQLPNTSAVLAAVAANPGAIGYVNATEVNNTVKVVAKIVSGKISAP